MFPSPDLPFPSVDAFMCSLTGDQRTFYLALEADREHRLQSTLLTGSRSLSGVSALLSDTVQIRIGRDGLPLSGNASGGSRP